MEKGKLATYLVDKKNLQEAGLCLLSGPCYFINVVNYCTLVNF